MRSIWAVARVTVREALRQKAVVALLVLLAILLPALGFTVSGDATLHGRAQMFLDWSLRMSRLLLGLMTIFVACGTIAWELKYKQAYITLVKPIPRWQFLVGKWVGIGLLNVALLAVVGLVIEGFAWQFRGRPGLGYDSQKGLYWKVDQVPLTALTEEDRQVEAREREILNREVLTARQGLILVGKEQLEADVDQELQKRRAANQMPAGMVDDMVRDDIRATKMREQALVPAYKSRDFRFTNLETARRKDGFIQIRYSIIANNSTPNDMMSYWWQIGDPRKIPKESLQYVPCVNEPVRTQHTIRVRADAISEDGELVVTFVNTDPVDPKRTWPADVVFAGDGSLEVLYPVGAFEPNLIRGLAMMLIQMLFLAALGLCAASLLTFPTACLACLLILAASSGVNYLLEAMTWTYKDNTAAVSHGVTLVTGPAVTLFLKSIPDLGTYSPSDAMVDGRVVAWSLSAAPSLGWALIDVGSRMVVVLLVGCWILSRREVAEVVV